MQSVIGPGTRGDAVVDANLAVIRESYESLIDVTAALAAPPRRAQEAPQ
jgi:hypothetical protein